jgi:plasmid stabilization system protein ParE
LPGCIAVNVRFHRQVQNDLNETLSQYYEVSDALGDDFFAEFQVGVARVCRNPRFFHFDASGLRRYNFDRFPYHFLYDIRDKFVRVWVVRHNHRNPSFGMRRFPR